ncbi:MAG: PucR family transcriptional regulator [Solirubrobacteraceae bacterium]
MASLGELVASPALSPLLGYVSRPRGDAVVEGVTLIEDLGHLERVREHNIVLLTRGVSATVSSYRFDMALRVARSRRVAALVLSTADIPSVASTTIAIAHRSGTAILGTGNDVNLADLALAIGRELTGDADVALLRAYTAVRSVEAHPSDGTVESLLERASAALGVPISMASSEPAELSSRPVVVDGRVEGWVAAPAQDGDLAMGLAIVLQAAAHSVADALERARRAQELPTQSRQEVITDLLAAPPKLRDQAVLRARSLGFPIDGWHVVARLDFENLSDTPPGEELAAYEERVRVGAAALQAARASGGTWHEARAGDAIVLINTYLSDPGATAAAEVADLMDTVLATVRDRIPTTLIRCGVGMAGAGTSGLLASLAESRSAVIAARTSRPASGAVAFDRFGLRRALVEWYASDTAREAAMSVLAPLSSLGGVRAERLIQTLHVYLDEQGSLTRTAQRMNLHRNAVAYRINRVFDLLEVERDNADDLLLLQLACRARELS